MFPMDNFSEIFLHRLKFVTISEQSKFLKNYFSGIFISNSVRTLDYNDRKKKKKRSRLQISFSITDRKN